ncbi:hypothetical protein ACIBMZ_29870 [Micromonospora sp. NPDC049900]|uniref:hypothetical protein n=1 Tax=Micromonospora sp. NPDC049900 TaxID=3364275 RepID=UPI00379B0BFB
MNTRAANALTARWTATLDDEATVLSGAGVHPLLALLTRYAHGPARAELSAVVGDRRAWTSPAPRAPGWRWASGRGAACRCPSGGAPRYRPPCAAS